MNAIFTKDLTAIFNAINRSGGNPLLVGGAVRDFILGIPPKDLDVEVYNLPADTLVSILEGFGKVDLVGKSFGVIKLTLPSGEDFDFSLPRRENKTGAGHRGFMVAADPGMTPREAAARRDFTWNALAMTPQGEIMDFFGGVSDLHIKVIRHTSEHFAEDPLRVLRGMNFAARFDMRVADETSELCRSLMKEAASLPRERVAAEWKKVVHKGKYPFAGLRFLQDTGWLDIFPTLRAIDGLVQDPAWHPEGDVLTHTGLALDALVENPAWQALPEEKKEGVWFAVLIHDLGKAVTTQTRDGRIVSPGHDAAGVELGKNLLSSICINKDVVKLALTLARHHMSHIGTAFKHNPGGAALKLADDLARGSPMGSIMLWAMVVEADHGARPPLPKGSPVEEWTRLAEELGCFYGPARPLLSGGDLIRAGMKANTPEIGKALKAVRSQQIKGILKDRTEALRWVRKAFPSQINYLTGEMLLELGIRPGREMGEILTKSMDAQDRGEINSRADAFAWFHQALGK